MKHLLSNWDEVEGINNILLLLDYDGTLTPIVERPELALLSDEMRELLRSLSKKYPLAIVSGRSLQDVKNLVRLDGIYYSGNHGFEVSGLGLELKNPEAIKLEPIIKEISEKLEREINIEGALVEDKGLTLSLHYRLVSESGIPELENILDSVTKPYLDKIRITHGKKVFEVRPDIDWDKGKAVLWLIDSIPDGRELLPIYLGDDRTDEDAFIALKDRGIGIIVSESHEKSNAKYFLRNVDEVRMFLERLYSMEFLG